MALYREATEVKRIADLLILEHHPHLELRMDEIRYVFRDDIPRSKGKATLGKARRVTGLACYLALAEWGSENTYEDHEAVGTDQFVMEISEPVWETLTEAQKAALVDHELCHFRYTDAIPPKKEIRPHSVEEFHEILHRHGLWKDDLKEFARHMPANQLRLTKED
jgi:hypothetical protein